MRVKSSVLDAYKALGKGYQTQMNRVLEIYAMTLQSRNTKRARNRRARISSDQILDALGRHFLGDEIRLADCQCHDGQRRVFRRAGGELAAVGHEQVLDVVSLAPLLTTPSSGFSDMRLVPRLWWDG